MHWFDTREGKLVVGEVAYEVTVENSAPNDIVRLEDAILDRKNDFPTDNFEKTDTSDWSEDDYIHYGKWAIQVLSQDERFKGLKRAHIERLGRLGIGPGRIAINNRFGPLFNQYLDALGEPHENQTSPYASWTRRNYAHYAQDLADKLGGPPTTDDFTAASQAGDGPGPWIMTKYMNTPGEINELNGYPNIYFWTEEDFIAWGARVIDINKGGLLTTRVMKILSKRGRGPGFITIKDQFGAISEFQRRATDRYQTDPTSEQPREAAAKVRLDELVSQNLVNKWIFKHLNGNNYAAFIAKYDIARELLTETDELEYGYIALLEPASDFVNKIISLRPRIKLEDIELSAIALGHAEDIWPLSQKWAQHLRVTEPMLNYKREANRTRYAPQLENNA